MCSPSTLAHPHCVRVKFIIICCHCQRQPCVLELPAHPKSTSAARGWGRRKAILCKKKVCCAMILLKHVSLRPDSADSVNCENVVSTNYKKGVPDFAVVRWLHHNIPRDSISSEHTVSFLLGAAFKASAGVPPLTVLQGLSCPQATPNRRFGNVPCLWRQMHKAVFDHDCCSTYSCALREMPAPLFQTAGRLKS